MMRGRILVVDHKTPTPDEDSGSASAFALLQILARAGFELTFAPITLADAEHYSLALNRLGIRTVSAPEWTSIVDVLEAFAPASDVLLLYRASVASRVFDIVRRVAPAAKILFHPVDLHFLRMQREAALSDNGADASAALAMRATELDLIARADASIVVSQYEFDLLRELAPTAVVHRIPILREVPQRSLRRAVHWSVRGSCYRLGVPGRWLTRLDPDFHRRRDFLFIGGFDHSPNVDAVRWFVGEVWPLLESMGCPGRFIIAGSKMPEAITQLAGGQIEARGRVATLAPLFAECRLSVAPIRYGAGIKGKIISSLSYGVPVVGTSVAAEGTGLRHNEDILIGDTPIAMAKQIMRLYEDPDLWLRLSANGYQTFVDEFSLAAGAPKVVGVVDELRAMTRR